MAGYLSVPTLEANFLHAVKATFDVQGSGLEGGRNGNGESVSMEMTGGGIVTASYENCLIKDKEQYEYVNWLGARLNGSFRYINVPIITDWFGVFPTIGGLPTPIVSGIPHSDGSFFDDGSGCKATVYGKVLENAGLNSGTLKLRLYGASRDIRWSEWFSIYHPTKGWRAHRNWDVLAKSAAGSEVDSGATRSFKDYTLALAPPLREAVTAGTRVELARPRFVAKFPTGFTLPSVVEAFFVTQQSMQFVEAFLMGWVPDNVIAALGQSHQLGIFLRIDTTPALHLWMGVNDVPIGFDSIDPDGTVYMGGGRLVGVPTLEVLVNGTSDSVEFTISGVDPATGAKMLESLPAVRGCAVQMGLTTLDDYFQPMSKIIPIWNGSASHIGESSTAVQGTSSATLTLSLSVVAGENTRSRAARAVWSSAQQKAFSPTDKFCDATARLARGVAPVWPNY